MKSQVAEPSQKPLYLNKEEALALLEMCLFNDTEDAPIKSDAMSKVGELCREFLRSETPPVRADAVSIHRSLQRDAIERLLRRHVARRTERSTICA